MEKQELKELLSKLNYIIDSTTLQNSLEKIVGFFSITSQLHDNLEEIRRLPIKRKNFFQLDSQAYERQQAFLQSVIKAGRTPHGYNRTERGQEVTSDSIFLGNVDGVWTASVAEISKFNADMPLKEKIQKQAFDFIKSYQEIFTVDFLRGRTKMIKDVESGDQSLHIFGKSE